MNVTFDDLLSTGAHFGHVIRKWNPNYRPYILMSKNGIHIINLDETLKELSKAVDYITEVVHAGGEVLFVGTKKNAMDIVQQEADKCGMFYVVERWLGGTLTNFTTIRKSIKRLHVLEKESGALFENATKKELLSLDRERLKLQDLHRGIKDMKRLPDVLIIVDGNNEHIAVNEAKVLNIPIVAVVDTDTDPRSIDYPIPANDDSIRAVKSIVSELSRAVCHAKSMEYPSDEEVVKETEEETEVEVKVDEPASEEKEELTEVSNAQEEQGDHKEEIVEEKVEKGTSENDEETDDDNPNNKEEEIIEEA